LSSNKINLKNLLPIFIGVFCIYYSFKDISFSEFKEYFTKINYLWVFVGIFLGALSHISRSYRWKFLIEPLGYKLGFINSVLTVFSAYLINYTVPRAGDIARGTMISKYENIPFEKTFGTIITERLVDLIFLLGFILLALSLQFDLIWQVIEEKKISLSSLIFTFLTVFLLFIILRHLFKYNQSKLINKIIIFFKGLAEGVLSFKSMNNKVAFVIHTIFIWVMYVAMFYVIKWTVPETESLGIVALLPAFVIGGLTISATNGGIGIYPFSVALMLSAFGISNESGLAFGWIVWTSQTLMIIVFGSLSFFVLPLVNRKINF